MGEGEPKKLPDLRDTHNTYVNMKSTSHVNIKLANRNVTTFMPLTTHQITTLKVFKSTGWNKVSGWEAGKGFGSYPDGPATIHPPRPFLQLLQYWAMSCSQNLLVSL